MISGVHTLIYAEDAEKARAFFKDILKLEHVDAGHGWLIFALPPGELACHPTEGKTYHELYLICEDIKATVAKLTRLKVKSTPIKDAGWGLVTSITVPGAGKMGLYEPRHPTAFKRPRSPKRSTRRKSAK
jgi:hypothetical protein